VLATLIADQPDRFAAEVAGFLREVAPG